MMQPASLCLEACRSLTFHPGGMASTGGVPSGKVSSFSDPRVAFSLAIIGLKKERATRKARRLRAALGPSALLVAEGEELGCSRGPLSKMSDGTSMGPNT